MSNTEFIVGQRWISNTEGDLGLGIVVEAANRRVEITFPASSEQRVYASDNAPLGRVIYPVGDAVSSADGRSFTIVSSRVEGGCVIYTGVDDQQKEVVLHEIDLDSFVHFSKPRDRLFAGQIDKPGRFRLRCQTLRHLQRIRQSPVYGLSGPRVQWLPHQLYIASQVAKRHAPRVLLADEVGLGKTIEAGLILHQQLINGRASRVLIVVPDSLLHQWLVEMLRRFNLHFTILDEPRCRSLEQHDENSVDEKISRQDQDQPSVDDETLPDELSEATGNGGDNPFESAQLVLCNLSFLVNNPGRLKQARSAQWDLLVVDEAHHLQWNKSKVSPAYACIESLAENTDGLLLLTATPEQLGVEGHFARLRLLDSDRYYDLEKFIEEENSYKGVSDLVDALLNSETLAGRSAYPEFVEQVAHYLGSATGEELARALQGDSAALKETTQNLIQRLLDRHGTGRVLFRNTREAVSGFPRRTVYQYPLPGPKEQISRTDDAITMLLQPEKQFGGSWLVQDSRVAWLVAWLAENRQHKVLLICGSNETARSLEEFLRLRQGVRSAVFHEGMTLLERDRAAAYFADQDDSAQVLICSEIGSEGRNFQFAHHLVLFDLPLNPDLLEQRIGRLDRIGQFKDVNLHVPYHENSAQGVLLRWYHEGLNAFEKVCPVGPLVYDRVATKLNHCLTHSDDVEALSELISVTRAVTEQATAELQQGRDRLLEMNSCNVPQAEKIIAELSELGQGRELEDYLAQAFDELGVEHYYHSADAIVVEPSDHMISHAIVGLPEEGLTATFSRTRALSREDMQFFTWEHPLVAGVVEGIADSDFGSATICTTKLPPLKPGTLLLEAVFVLRCMAPRALQVQRYISRSLVRVVVDEQGRDLTEVLSEEQLAGICKPVKKNVAGEMVKHIRGQVDSLTDYAEALAEPQQEQIVIAAQQRASEVLGEEIHRLQALAQVNPNIRQVEIEYLRDTRSALQGYLDGAELLMDAIRVIVVVP